MPCKNQIQEISQFIIVKKTMKKHTSGTCFLSNCFRIVGDIREKQRFESSTQTFSISSSTSLLIIVESFQWCFSSSNSITRSKSIDCSSSVQLIKSFRLNNGLVHESINNVNDDGDDCIKSLIDISSSKSVSLIKLPKSFNRLAKMQSWQSDCR